MITMMTAITSTMWISPPAIGKTVKPKSHKTSNTAAIVRNIGFLPFLLVGPAMSKKYFHSAGGCQFLAKDRCGAIFQFVEHALDLEAFAAGHRNAGDQEFAMAI